MDTQTPNTTTLKSYQTAMVVINQNLNGRTPILMGESPEFRQYLLENYGLTIPFTITTIEKKVNEHRVLLSSLKDQQEKYYIILPFDAPTASLRKLLEANGYQEYLDYIFINRKKAIIKSSKTTDYTDGYGNYVHPGCATVTLSRFAVNTHIYVDDSARGDLNIRVFGNGGGHVHIGQRCRFGGTRIFVHDNGCVELGNKITFGEISKISAMPNNRVVLGNDCMISSNVLIFSGDGHAIFDMQTGQRTNALSPDDPRGTIILGRHVWVGAGAYILNRSQIGNSCIIGANATFKGTLPDHSVAAGNPARMIRQGVAWSRDPHATDINTCFADWNAEELSEDDDTSEE